MKTKSITHHIHYDLNVNVDPHNTKYIAITTYKSDELSEISIAIYDKAKNFSWIATMNDEMFDDLYILLKKYNKDDNAENTI